MSKAKEGTVLEYHLKFTDGKSIQYDFIGEELLKLKLPENPNNEEWMKLGFHQCENCPLNTNTHFNCPVAQNLSVMLNDWSQVVSYDEVELLVISKQRSTSAKTTAQKALSSILGLIMATSDCPHTRFFRAMAKFHLPLSSNEETSFRALSTYFMMQFFESEQTENMDFSLDGLKSIYENMHTVNIHMKQRLENAVIEDAALNAVVILDLFAISLPYYLDDELEKLRPLFFIHK